MNNIDMAKFWANMPSRDIEEALRAKQPPGPTPAVQIGTVEGDAITVNVMPGAEVDLKALLASRARK